MLIKLNEMIRVIHARPMRTNGMFGRSASAQVQLARAHKAVEVVAAEILRVCRAELRELDPQQEESKS